MIILYFENAHRDFKSDCSLMALIAFYCSQENSFVMSSVDTTDSLSDKTKEAIQCEKTAGEQEEHDEQEEEEDIDVMGLNVKTQTNSNELNAGEQEKQQQEDEEEEEDIDVMEFIVETQTNSNENKHNHIQMCAHQFTSTPNNSNAHQPIQNSNAHQPAPMFTNQLKKTVNLV